MEKNTKIRFLFYPFILLLSITSLISSPLNLHAWARHNLITKYALKYNEDYRNSIITVTEILSDNSINPDYLPVYTNPDLQKNSVNCNKFVNYDLENGMYYGFDSKWIGERITIYDVLVNFSDEPDWGMDKNLNLSFAQNFMAGSQGFRHMYYPFWTLHIPYPLVAQGNAPGRAQHFFDLAVSEFRKGNFYSAYRQLARSIHYVMDMGQPFHTRQLYYKFLQFTSPFDGTVQAIKNYHFAYETFVANLLQREDCAHTGILVNAIGSTKPLSAESAEKLAVSIAIKSSAIAKKLFPLAVKVFGERFNSQKEVFLTGEEFIELVSKQELTEELIKLTEESLILTSGGIKGVMILFEKRIKESE